jgi:8-oxo-dGTP pyrophosphatase MutT (NUDIX family)
MQLRICVAAIVIQNEQLLVIRKRLDDGKAFYSVPTGGQEPGETLVEAVQREVLEEVGAEIFVDRLLFVREYIGKNHENAHTDNRLHLVDHLFQCYLKDPAPSLQGTAPDPDQEVCEWLPLHQLTTYRFYPRALIPYLIELGQGLPLSAPVYIGDIN